MATVECAALGIPLSVINPAMIVGPVYAAHQVSGGVELVRALATSRFGSAPPLGYGLIDVRDVAAAATTALERGAIGRFILCARNLWLAEVAALLAARFPEWRIATRRLPGLAVLLAGLFARQVPMRYLRSQVGRKDEFDTTRASELLGIPLTPPGVALADTLASLQRVGAVTPRSPRRRRRQWR